MRCSCVLKKTITNKMYKMKILIIFFLCLPLFFSAHAISHARTIPEHNLEAPSTASAQLKQAIDFGLPDWWQTKPKNFEEWKNFQKIRNAEAMKRLPELMARLGVRSVGGELSGVPVFTLEPAEIPLRNRDRVLLHLHGGGYVLNGGEAGIGEGVFMAGIGKFRVVSVDYRMPPEFPFPAALDDAMKVYRSLLEKYPPSHIGIFGTSTGGGMTLALVIRAKHEGLPLPGAIAAGTPWSDLTMTGDSYATNEKIDNVLVGYDGWLEAAAEAYANGHDLKDPLLSPVYGEYKGFPPTILGTGTRDLFLSNTIRVHKKLLEAGVPAQLLVLEGISHAQYMLLGPDAPEANFYFGQVADFFDKYLE